MCSLQAPGAAAPHERHRGFPQAGREARPAAVIGKAPGAARGGLSGAASPLAQLEASRGSITPPSLPGTAREHLPQELQLRAGTDGSVGIGAE